MPDDSHLDRKYFLKNGTYNCPFCNRRGVPYSIANFFQFDWNDSKRCFGYLIRCRSCQRTSMHLSGKPLARTPTGDFDALLDLDDEFFYSVPTSFFVTDDRIPSVLRELVTEAEGCLKMNFLTGASACVRKTVYELAKLEGATGEHYDERLKSLKAKRTDVDASYFDTLLSVQEMTSNKVHENAYDGWKSEHLRLMLMTLTEILNEMYVVPKEKGRRRQAILDLKKEVAPEGGGTKKTPPASAAPQPPISGK
jgi:hypothetical protein